MFNSIDTAFYHPIQECMYLFKGEGFIKYKSGQGVELITVESIGIIGVDGWLGLPKAFCSDIDTAFIYHNEYLYFFKGEEFVRWDVANDTLSPGYPKNINAIWSGLATHFTEDGQLRYYEDSDSITAFFKSGKHLQHMRGDTGLWDVCSWTSGVWKGSVINSEALPKNFLQHLDAVVHLPCGETYFFAGHDYLVWNTADGLLTGYPKPITTEQESALCIVGV